MSAPENFGDYRLFSPVECDNLDDIEPSLGFDCEKPRSDKKSGTRNSSAYALFFREQQAKIRRECPAASFGQVSKVIALRWESLHAQQKQAYQDKVKARKRERLMRKAAERALNLLNVPTFAGSARPLPHRAPDPAVWGARDFEELQTAPSDNNPPQRLRRANPPHL